MGKLLFMLFGFSIVAFTTAKKRPTCSKQIPQSDSVYRPQQVQNPPIIDKELANGLCNGQTGKVNYDCKRYVDCSTGVINDCPPGTEWSQKEQQCEHKHLAKCSSNSGPDKSYTGPGESYRGPSQSFRSQSQSKIGKRPFHP
ncbi:hypothetical protein B4U79_18730 [Dinothrombium tinctorium]|uniref:Chitin-binding type-2 domain-containing protein n=1 Tax=Dinothrombium tinctorium TaxID=1965070 RepID=A0A3S3NCE0_9ACAR|nr:hypothetical protein B4U79_18730 [Dinothrombium tinctorium]